MISSRNGITYSLLLDIRIAFNSVKRNAITEDLKNMLNQDKLDLIRILLDVKIGAKFGNFKSKHLKEFMSAPESSRFT